MIEVEALEKSYEGAAAVAGVSFTVRSGEILGLVGVNGAGKTTTLRCVCGILRPTRGTVRIAGHDVVREPARAKRRVAYVPDTPHPFDLLTVREHLRFTALAYGLKGAAAAHADDLLAELGLHEKREALASTLSRGMRQKLAIACAFLRAPDAILLDEPLTGLDPRGIRDMRDAVARRAAAGAAIVVSSHQLELVERLCSRVLVLHRGRVRAEGTLAEVKALARSSGSLEDAFFAITESAESAEGAEDAGGGAP